MSAFDRWLTTDPRDREQEMFENWCDANGVDPGDQDADERFEAWLDQDEVGVP